MEKEKQKPNRWKTATLILAVCLIVLSLYQMGVAYNEEKQLQEKICDSTKATPSWFDNEGRLVKIGVISPAENFTKDEFTNKLIEHRIYLVYNENCGACQYQKNIFGEDNWNRYFNSGLALDCKEFKE